MTDEKLKEELIKKGYQRIRFFSWDNTASKTLKIYQRVMAEQLSKSQKLNFSSNKNPGFLTLKFNSRMDEKKKD